MITFASEAPCDGAEIEILLEAAFGPARLLKPSYILRRHTAPVAALSYTAWQGDQLVGTVRCTPVHIQNAAKHFMADALLLGPLAVSPNHQALGIGRGLMRMALEQAKALRHQYILLVGDLDYYRQFGFARVAANSQTLSGLDDIGRLLLFDVFSADCAPQDGKLLGAGEIKPGWCNEATDDHES